ncbi:MAG: hypothetical protein V1932_02185 [Chloroflexota bacterium]
MSRLKGETKVNLQKATKEMVEGIVARGCVENEARQILISTAALLCDFLFSQSVDSELRIQVQERQKEVGLFFPPLVEAIFEWVTEGRESIIEEIRALARD